MVSPKEDMLRRHKKNETPSGTSSGLGSAKDGQRHRPPTARSFFGQNNPPRHNRTTTKPLMVVICTLLVCGVVYTLLEPSRRQGVSNALRRGKPVSNDNGNSRQNDQCVLLHTSSVEHLQTLTELNLKSCELTSIPSEIRHW